MPPPSISAGGGNVWTNNLTPTVSVTTAATDYILVLSVYNEHTGTAAATVTSVTSSGMTWALRKRSNGSATGGLEVWWAHGTGTLTSYIVTINMSGAHDDGAASVCVVTGANSAAPWDTNASLPAAQSASSVNYTPSQTGLSTSSANDVLLYFTGSVAPTGAWTPPSGYTNTDRHANGGGSWACMLSVDTLQVTATQSGITVTGGSALSNPFGGGTATCGEVIFDAIRAAAAPTTWSTTDKGASIVLSNANLTATTGGVSGAAIRSKDPKRTGKYYIEATLNWTAVGQFADRFGVALGGSSIADFSAGIGGTVSFRTDGQCNVFGGSGTFVTPSIAAGNIVGIAIDLDAQLIWFRLTSGPSNNWNTGSTSTADPVAGVGGLSFATGPYGLGRGVYDAYIWASVDSGAGQAITLNAGGSAFNGTVPTGYTAGWDDSVSPSLNLVGSQYAVEAFGSLGSTVAMQVTQVVAEVWYSTAPIVSASGAFVVIMA